MHEAGIRRRIGPVRDRLRLRLVGDVHDEHAAVDVSEIKPVGPLLVDIGVVRAMALVELVARQRRLAFLGARHPPAADLDRLRRIAHVDAAVELVVERMARREVGGARRHVHVFAVAEPQLMHAARGRARAIEKRNRARLFRHRHVEQFEPGRLLPDLLGLIGDRHDVAGQFQRIRAHIALRQFGLHHHFGLARIGDIDAGEILRRAFMRQPDDAAAVFGDLHRHAFAHAAEAAEIVLRQQLEIPGDGFAGLGQRIVGGGHFWACGRRPWRGLFWVRAAKDNAPARLTTSTGATRPDRLKRRAMTRKRNRGLTGVS